MRQEPDTIIEYGVTKETLFIIGKIFNKQYYSIREPCPIKNNFLVFYSAKKKGFKTTFRASTRKVKLIVFVDGQ